MNNITDLDYIAYELYADAVKKNPPIWGQGGIDDIFVGDIKRFVIHRKQHYNNLLFYYQKANIELRKQKLNKLNET